LTVIQFLCVVDVCCTPGAVWWVCMPLAARRVGHKSMLTTTFFVCFCCRATSNIRWQRFIIYSIDELHNASISCSICEKSSQNSVQQHHHCKGLHHSYF